MNFYEILAPLNFLQQNRKRGRGALGKTPVFGLLKRQGKVLVQIVKNCSKEELLPIIQGKILEGAIVHTDGWKAYDGLYYKWLRPLPGISF